MPCPGHAALLAVPLTLHYRTSVLVCQGGTRNWELDGGPVSFSFSVFLGGRRERKRNGRERVAVVANPNPQPFAPLRRGKGLLVRVDAGAGLIDWISSGWGINQTMARVMDRRHRRD